MNLDEIRLADDLRLMVQTSQGYKRLLEHINDEMSSGWEEFIDMPVEKKTSKLAYFHAARYKVLKELLEWINESIRAGEQEKNLVEKENERKVKLATTY